MYTHVYTVHTLLSIGSMWWLRLVGSLKLQVSFAEYRLFYRAILQKRPIILRSLLVAATPYVYTSPTQYMCIHVYIYWVCDVPMYTSIPLIPSNVYTQCAMYTYLCHILWPFYWACNVYTGYATYILMQCIHLHFILSRYIAYNVYIAYSVYTLHTQYKSHSIWHIAMYILSMQCLQYSGPSTEYTMYILSMQCIH